MKKILLLISVMVGLFLVNTSRVSSYSRQELLVSAQNSENFLDFLERISTEEFQQFATDYLFLERAYLKESSGQEVTPDEIEKLDQAIDGGTFNWVTMFTELDSSKLSSRRAKLQHRLTSLRDESYLDPKFEKDLRITAKYLGTNLQVSGYEKYRKMGFSGLTFFLSVINLAKKQVSVDNFDVFLYRQEADGCKYYYLDSEEVLKEVELKDIVNLEQVPSGVTMVQNVPFEQLASDHCLLPLQLFEFKNGINLYPMVVNFSQPLSDHFGFMINYGRVEHHDLVLTLKPTGVRLEQADQEYLLEILDSATADRYQQVELEQLTHKIFRMLCGHNVVFCQIDHENKLLIAGTTKARGNIQARINRFLLRNFSYYFPIDD